jgi:hypothetical protein
LTVTVTSNTGGTTTGTPTVPVTVSYVAH